MGLIHCIYTGIWLTPDLRRPHRFAIPTPSRRKIPPTGDFFSAIRAQGEPPLATIVSNWDCTLKNDAEAQTQRLLPNMNEISLQRRFLHKKPHALEAKSHGAKRDVGEKLNFPLHNERLNLNELVYVKSPLKHLASTANTILERALGLRLQPYDRDSDPWVVHKQQAAKALGAVETEFSPLTAKARSEARAYAIEVLRDEDCADWLYVYAAVRGRFVEGWMPDNFFGEVVCPSVNRNLGALTDCKTLTQRVLQTSALPDLAYFVGGRLFDRSFTPIALETLRPSLEEAGEDVVLKSDFSAFSSGVSKAASKSLQLEDLQAKGDCVIQSYIRQNPFFSQFSNASVATIAVTTVLEPNGEFRVRASSVRLGCDDDPWLQGDHQIRVPILSSKGELADEGVTYDWRRRTTHPSSQTRFAAKVIPGYQKAVDLCTELHAKVPHFGVLVWDIAIDESERPILIEWSGNHPNIVFSEALLGPCFAGLGWERL